MIWRRGPKTLTAKCGEDTYVIKHRKGMGYCLDVLHLGTTLRFLTYATQAEAKHAAEVIHSERNPDGNHFQAQPHAGRHRTPA